MLKMQIFCKIVCYFENNYYLCIRNYVQPYYSTIMKTNFEILNEALALLNADEQQILKDAITCGCDAEVRFRTEDWGIGYITNDAVEAGHFTEHQRPDLFRSIYRKLGLVGVCFGCNENFDFCNNWRGDGHSDMFFIRLREDEAGTCLVNVFEEWARS